MCLLKEQALLLSPQLLLGKLLVGVHSHSHTHTKIYKTHVPLSLAKRWRKLYWVILVIKHLPLQSVKQAYISYFSLPLPYPSFQNSLTFCFVYKHFSSCLPQLISISCFYRLELCFFCFSFYILLNIFFYQSVFV